MIFQHITDNSDNPTDLRREVTYKVSSRRTPKLNNREAHDVFNKNASFQIVKQIQLQEYIRTSTTETLLTSNSGLPYDSRYHAYEYAMFKNQGRIFELDLSRESMKLIHFIYGSYNPSVVNMLYSQEELDEFNDLASGFMYNIMDQEEKKRFIELLKKNDVIWREMGRGLRLNVNGEASEEDILATLRNNLHPVVTKLMNKLYSPIYRQEVVNSFKLSFVSCDEHRVLVTTGAEEVRIHLRLKDTMFTLEGKAIGRDDS